MKSLLSYIFLAGLLLASFACQQSEFDEELDVITQTINKHRGEEPFQCFSGPGGIFLLSNSGKVG